VFTEVLRIKPVLDPAGAAQMEANLGGRFRRLSTSFGRGLKGAIKGSFLGISLGLLARFLNPLEKLEDKIRKLLDEAKTQGDLADEFNTSPGKLRAIQDVAGTLGVTPDSLKETLNKYAQQIEKAREELADPTAKLSDSTRALKNFANDKDLAESFLQFAQSLKTTGQSDKGVGQVYTKTGVRDRTAQETREAQERAVFGETLKGQQKRLIDANYADAFKKQPAGVAKLDEAYKNLGEREQQDRNLRINRETADFLKSSKQITPTVVTSLSDAEQKKIKKDQEDMKYFNDFRRAQDAMDRVTILVENLGKALLTIVTKLSELQQSRWFRSDGGKK